MNFENTGKTFRKSFNISLPSIVAILGKPNTKADINAICAAEGLPCVDEWDTYCLYPTADSRRALRFNFWHGGKRGWATITILAGAGDECRATVRAFVGGGAEPRQLRFY